MSFARAVGGNENDEQSRNDEPHEPKDLGVLFAWTQCRQPLSGFMDALASCVDTFASRIGSRAAAHWGCWTFSFRSDHQAVRRATGRLLRELQRAWPRPTMVVLQCPDSAVSARLVG